MLTGYRRVTRAPDIQFGVRDPPQSAGDVERNAAAPSDSGAHTARHTVPMCAAFLARNVRFALRKVRKFALC